MLPGEKGKTGCVANGQWVTPMEKAGTREREPWESPLHQAEAKIKGTETQGILCKAAFVLCPGLPYLIRVSSEYAPPLPCSPSACVCYFGSNCDKRPSTAMTTPTPHKQAVPSSFFHKERDRLIAEIADVGVGRGRLDPREVDHLSAMDRVSSSC